MRDEKPSVEEILFDRRFCPFAPVDSVVRTKREMIELFKIFFCICVDFRRYLE